MGSACSSDRPRRQRAKFCYDKNGKPIMRHEGTGLLMRQARKVQQEQEGGGRYVESSSRRDGWGDDDEDEDDDDVGDEVGGSMTRSDLYIGRDEEHSLRRCSGQESASLFIKNSRNQNDSDQQQQSLEGQQKSASSGESSPVSSAPASPTSALVEDLHNTVPMELGPLLYRNKVSIGHGGKPYSPLEKKEHSTATANTTAPTKALTVNTATSDSAPITTSPVNRRRRHPSLPLSPKHTTENSAGSSDAPFTPPYASLPPGATRRRSPSNGMYRHRSSSGTEDPLGGGATLFPLAFSPGNTALHHQLVSGSSILSVSGMAPPSPTTTNLPRTGSPMSIGCSWGGTRSPNHEESANFIQQMEGSGLFSAPGSLYASTSDDPLKVSSDAESPKSNTRSSTSCAAAAKVTLPTGFVVTTLPLTDDVCGKIPLEVANTGASHQLSSNNVNGISSGGMGDGTSNSAEEMTSISGGDISTLVIEASTTLLSLDTITSPATAAMNEESSPTQ